MHNSPFLTSYFLLEVNVSLPTVQQLGFCINASLKANFQPYSTSLEGLQDDKPLVYRSFAEGKATDSLSV